MATKEKKIKIVVDSEKIRKTEKLRNVRNAQKGDVDAAVGILAKYAVYENGSNPAKKVPYEEAVDFLLDHTAEELEKMISTFSEGVSNIVVSP